MKHWKGITATALIVAGLCLAEPMADAVSARLMGYLAPASHVMWEQEAYLERVGAQDIALPGESAPDAVTDEDEAFYEMEDELIEQALLEQGYYREDVPLSFQTQDYLHTACDTYGVPYEIALAVIEIESGFHPDARNGSHVGLFQLSERYFGDVEAMSDMEEIHTAIGFLGGQIDKYGLEGGIQSYHDGHDTGRRDYCNRVLALSEVWKR